MIVDQMENRSGVRTRMLSTANTGIARPTLLMLIARVPPLPSPRAHKAWTSYRNPNVLASAISFSNALAEQS